MTEYGCKYVPVEILEGFGARPVLCNPCAENFERADRVIHRDVCAYARALIETRMRRPDSALVLTDCCDSLRRACDVLRAQNQRIFLLHLPRRDGPCAREFYRRELCRLIDEFSAGTGAQFDRARFREACGEKPEVSSAPSVALLGARVSDRLLERIRALSPLPVANLTCTGNRRVGPAPETDDREELMDWYAGELLSQPPCMRMTDIAPRRELLEDPNLCGVIYSTVSFCDYYGFEYAGLRKSLSVPMVKIETDYTGQADAQLENRLDAFFEALRPPRPSGPKAARGGPQSRADAGRYFAGIDSGSTSTNAVILGGDRRIVSSAVVPTGADAPESARRAFAGALQKAGLDGAQIARTVATGYGRTAVGLGGRDVTEITCHARGARFLNPAVRTVIDIGGQDSKMIRLHPDGTVKDFTMNDKCAAGTGRFLEMMAQSLGVTLKELSTCGLRWKEEVTISSMCSVFAQSEVVSLVAAGKRLPDIAHGLYGAVASKVTALGGRTGAEPVCMMTGGVANNAGVVRAVSEKLGFPVEVPEHPELCGALGAALLALEDGGTAPAGRPKQFPRAKPGRA